MIVKSKYIPDKNVTVYIVTCGSKFVCSYCAESIVPDLKKYEKAAKRWWEYTITPVPQPLTQKQADKRFCSLVKALSDPNIEIEVS